MNPRIKKVLWLCSWYPHPGNPFEGDFIQRHARAVATFTEVDVIFVNQDGPAFDSEETTITQMVGGVTETLTRFQYKRTGIRLLDRLRYNWLYYQHYRKSIRDYFERKGRPDLVHVHIPLKAGAIAQWIKRTWGIPYLATEHSSHYTPGSDDAFQSKTKLHRYRVGRVFQNASIVTSVSAAVGEKLKSLFELKRVDVVRNVVDTRLFFYRQTKPQPFRFIHVSTLASFQKNVQGILRAVAKLVNTRRDFELLLVGPAHQGLKAEVIRMGLEGMVRFTGEIPYESVAKEMQAASAFILFSRHENFPCVMIEALCCGLPFIGTDTGGVSEAIDRSNGVVIASEDEEALQAAMHEMIDHYDQYDRKEIARIARERYAYSTIGREFMQLYEEVLQTSS